jgi:hypothetical protein
MIPTPIHPKIDPANPFVGQQSRNQTLESFVRWVLRFGTLVIVSVTGVYMLKSAGALFWNHLADCSQHMGFNPCLANPDLCMQATEKADGTKY